MEHPPAPRPSRDIQRNTMEPAGARPSRPPHPYHYVEIDLGDATGDEFGKWLEY